MVKREGKLILGLFVGVIICLSLVNAIDSSLSIYLDKDFDEGIVVRLRAGALSGPIFSSLYPKLVDGVASSLFSTNRDQVYVSVMFIKNGIVTETHDEGPFNTGEVIVLDYRTVVEEEAIENITEETVIEGNGTILGESFTPIAEGGLEELEEKNSSFTGFLITGKVITGQAVEWLKTISVYYYLGIFGFVFILIVLIAGVKQKRKSANNNFGVIDNSEPMIFSKFEKHRYDHLNEDLTKAKQKLKEAEDGLETVRKEMEQERAKAKNNPNSKEEQIRRIEEKMKREQDALDKLKGKQEEIIDKKEEDIRKVEQQPTFKNQDNNNGMFKGY